MATNKSIRVHRIVSLSVNLLVIASLLIDSIDGAPQLGPSPSALAATTTNTQDKLQARNTEPEKTADLIPLINETLSLSNKSTNVRPPADRQHLKDDWTFDMVEYDLMEFLQDLSARYRLANGNKSLTDESIVGLEGKKEDTSLSDLKKELDWQDQIAKKLLQQRIKEQKQPSAATKSVDTTTTSTTSSNLLLAKATNQPELSSAGFSLASGDNDFAESTWQYGIFDRFTRPRSTTSTTTTPEPILKSDSNIDVRSFNSDECGLRTYTEEEPSHYPTFEEEQAQQTASKELNQRRQRPPLGSTFFSSHKKFQSSSIADELAADSDRGDVRPPFDSYGEPASSSSSSSSGANQRPEEDELNKHWPLSSSASDNNPADSEFNLSFRRQWLQQQLGQTLSMLGFNSTGSSGKLAFDFLNDTAPAYMGSSLKSSRENMMKMSSKTAKSIDRLDDDETKLTEASSAGVVGEKPSSLLKKVDSGAAAAIVEPTEQELKARQDELKLEARVIGGSDARLGDSPWSVSLQALVARPGTGGVEYRHYCGGTIISEYYILTAAHCLDFMVGRESRLFVVVGDLNWRMSAASLHGRRFGIEKLIIHSGYKSTAFGHDIGLIRTKESMKPLKVNGRYIINSVCLPEKGVEHSGEAELVGWGLFSNRNEMADSLQIADVPILPRPLCVDLYKRRTGLIQWLIGIELITEKQICAGTFGRGICQGDSGSALVFNEKVSRVFSSPASSASTQHNSRLDAKAHPLRRFSNVARDQQNRATIIGIVAFGGIRRCSYQSLPGVYMQTSKYMDWIMPRVQS